MWRILLTCAAVLLFSLAGAGKAPAVVPVMRVSLENTDDHMQTAIVRRFVQQVNEQLQGRLKAVVYANARLFRDRDVVYALAQGKVEMAVPGIWNIARIEPSVNLFMLPMFYGRAAQDTHTLLEGHVGQSVVTRIENATRSVVLGTWLDLGHAQLFTLKAPLDADRLVKGLHIRVAGGLGNEMRISALGGLPRIIAWPGLPSWLESGTVDGVLTTYETVVSARLWEHGIRYAFEDRQYFAQYVPLVNARFWAHLPGDVRHELAALWNRAALEGRKEAAAAQEQAKKTLRENGVRITVPSAPERRALRDRVLPAQDAIARATHVDPALAAEAATFLNSLEEAASAP
jgi:C4-dicarboxylate-binding protein DctP